MLLNTERLSTYRHFTIVINRRATKDEPRDTSRDLLPTVMLNNLIGVLAFPLRVV